MNRIIKKVAVLGSGVMGSRIACHFANIGVQTILLDILNPKLEKDNAAEINWLMIVCKWPLNKILPQYILKRF